MTTVGTVAEIWRHPVKSMQGERVEAVALGPAGIPGDRRFAVRDVGTGKIASAKQPRPWAALLECSARAGGDPAIDPPVVTLPDGTDLPADDPALAAALGNLIGREVVLEEATGAPTSYASWWPEVEGLALSGVEIDLPMALGTDSGAFVDLAALHLVTTGSLRHLAALLAEADPDAVIDVRRFRPSMVIDTPDDEAFAETTWRDAPLRVGGTVELAVGPPSPRCVMTTLPQPGLGPARSVLQTLARTNRVETPGIGAFACFGLYAEVSTGGTVRVGDTVSR